MRNIIEGRGVAATIKSTGDRDACSSELKRNLTLGKVVVRGPMPRRKAQRAEVTKVWRPNRKNEIGRKVELYSAAYKLAWQQIPPLLRSERPDIPLRIHASIRRELKGGTTNPKAIAFAALKDVHEESDLDRTLATPRTRHPVSR